MGGQQSTRRISIDNDGDPASVIKVSESVAERIKGKSDQQQEKEEEDVKKPSVRKHNLPNYRHVSVPENLAVQGLPYITSKDIQQELEREIEKNNQYWEKRIGELQKTHGKMNNIIEEEYLKATEEMAKLLPRLPNPHGAPPCQDDKTVVAKCYKNHSGQTLNCAREVERFASCMTNTRIRLQNEGKLD